MTILLVVVFLTLFVSAQCSLFESILYSTRIGTLESAKSKKRTLALRMIGMKREIGIPIAAILILNTVANTAGATIAGMYAHKVLGASLVIPFSILFTLAILILAEILPKTIGALHWRSLWPLIVLPLTVMSKGFYPVIVITNKLTSFLTRGSPIPAITEEDILGAIKLGSSEGEITEWESAMVHNIINLEDKNVSEIMTPRGMIFSLDEKMQVGEAFEATLEKGFTRIPVFSGDRENIVGYVILHDLRSSKAHNNPNSLLSEYAKPISYVAETEHCLNLLARFLKKRQHLTVVEDEYGGVAGIVTLEDLLETVLGTEIVDETDTVDDLQKLARKRKADRSESR